MSVSGMKQDRTGHERNKASGGGRSLKAQHSQVRKTWCGSLLEAESAEGRRDLEGGLFVAKVIVPR
jgi:hypothetical protein